MQMQNEFFTLEDTPIKRTIKEADKKFITRFEKGAKIFSCDAFKSLV